MGQRQEIPAGMAHHAGIAKVLNVSPARVSQLLGQGVLEENEAGLVEIESAVERFAVYKSAPGEVRWERFASRLEQEATQLQPELDRLLAGKIASCEEFRGIADRINKLLSSMRFTICSQPGDQTFILQLWDHWSRSLQGSVCGQALHLFARESGSTWEQCYEQLCADLARGKDGHGDGKPESEPKCKRGKRPASDGARRA